MDRSPRGEQSARPARPTVVVKTLGGRRFPFELDVDATFVVTLKELLAPLLGEEVQNLTLVCGGTRLADNDVIGAYLPAEGAPHLLHVLRPGRPTNRPTHVHVPILPCKIP